MKPEVVLATHNPGKLREFQDLLKDASFALRALETRGEIVEETGTTYLQNARLKAHFTVKSNGRHALADDSGVEVDGVDGLPGVQSARFVSDVPWENSREILLRLMEVPPPHRSARMRAVLCLAWPDGREIAAEGVVEGVILGWPRGQHGFGVDPIFSIDGTTSLAELEPGEKNRLSHRARAVEALMIKVSTINL